VGYGYSFGLWFGLWFFLTTGHVVRDNLTISFKRWYDRYDDKGVTL
jgi:hypothetical protein